MSEQIKEQMTPEQALQNLERATGLETFHASRQVTLAIIESIRTLDKALTERKQLLRTRVK